jgi:predicted N-acyltransferase
VGGVTQQMFAAIGTLGWRPLRMDVAFVEIPFCNLPGLLLTPEGERREVEVVSEMIRFARAELRCDIFCVKTYGRKPSEQTLAGLGMMHTSFPANTCLQLPFSTFDEYMNSLTQEHRRIVRVNQRRFAAVNGRVRRVTNLTSEMRTTMDLFHSTDAFHGAQGDLERPLEMDADFLRSLERNAELDRRFFLLAEVDGQTVAAALMLRSGKQLIFVKAGLDYEIARTSRAYFNLYYAMTEWAIENRLEFIQLSAEAYEVKRRIGGTTAPVSYYFDINNRWIAPAVKLAAKHFSGQKGSTIGEAHA